MEGVEIVIFHRLEVTIELFEYSFQGVLPDGLIVAIKRFRDPWGPQSVMQYAGIFSMLLQHENVVTFLGYCHEDRREMVIEEYMPKGNLSSVIDGMSQALKILFNCGNLFG